MELVESKRKEAFCDSNMVSRKFGIKHNKVVRTIGQLIIDLKYLKGTTCTHEYYTEERVYQGHKYTAYLMNKKFFIMLAMRFRGKKAMQWQSLFIDAFESMEKRITLFDQNSKDPIWLKSRAMTKIARKEETDIIKKFVDYATEQGSKNAKFYYKHVTNSTYKALGLLEQKKPKLRDTMSVYEQASLVLAEKIVLDSFKKYMDLGRNYKDIYESVKEDLLKYGPGLSFTQTKE